MDDFYTQASLFRLLNSFLEKENMSLIVFISCLRHIRYRLHVAGSGLEKLPRKAECPESGHSGSQMCSLDSSISIARWEPALKGEWANWKPRSVMLSFLSRGGQARTQEERVY